MKKYTLKSLLHENSSESLQAQTQQEKIQTLISSTEGCEILEEEAGYLFFKYLGVKMLFLSDEKHDRMRIISPITPYSELAPKIKDALMHSNFHSALDARYGVSEDTLFAAFLHPLSTLDTKDCLSALKQVKNLAQSFAKTYSSAQIAFTNKK